MSHREIKISFLAVQGPPERIRGGDSSIALAHRGPRIKGPHHKEESTYRNSTIEVLKIPLGQAPAFLATVLMTSTPTRE